MVFVLLLLCILAVPLMLVGLFLVLYPFMWAVLHIVGEWIPETPIQKWNREQEDRIWQEQIVAAKLRKELDKAAAISLDEWKKELKLHD